MECYSYVVVVSEPEAFEFRCFGYSYEKYIISEFCTIFLCNHRGRCVCLSYSIYLNRLFVIQPTYSYKIIPLCFSHSAQNNVKMINSLLFERQHASFL